MCNPLESAIAFHERMPAATDILRQAAPFTDCCNVMPEDAAEIPGTSPERGFSGRQEFAPYQMLVAA